MAAGLVAMLGGGLALAGGPPVLAAILAVPGWISLRLMVAIVDPTAAIPFASVTLPAPVAWAVAIATVIAIVVVRHGRSRGPWRASSSVPAVASRPVARRATAPVSRSTRLAIVLLAVSVVIGGAVVISRPSG